MHDITKTQGSLRCSSRWLRAPCGFLSSTFATSFHQLHQFSRLSSTLTWPDAEKLNYTFISSIICCKKIFLADTSKSCIISRPALQESWWVWLTSCPILRPGSNSRFCCSADEMQLKIVDSCVPKLYLGCPRGWMFTDHITISLNCSLNEKSVVPQADR